MEPEGTGKNRNPDGTFPPGVSGNPKGRPPGVSIKEKVRAYLDTHPEDVDQVVQHFVKKNRELMWQMLEGRPQQDVTSGGEKLPTPIYVPENHSSPEDSEPEQED